MKKKIKEIVFAILFSCGLLLAGAESGPANGPGIINIFGVSLVAASIIVIEKNKEKIR